MDFDENIFRLLGYVNLYFTLFVLKKTYQVFAMINQFKFGILISKVLTSSNIRSQYNHDTSDEITTESIREDKEWK